MKTLSLMGALILSWQVAAQQAEAPLDTLELGFGNVLEGVREVLEAAEDAPDDWAVKSTGREPMTLSARQCVEMALQRNPRAFRAQAEVAAAKARVGQVRAGLYPRLGVQVAYNYREDIDLGIDSNLLTDLLGVGTGDIRKLSRSDRFFAEQVLFTGGGLRAALKASKFLAKSEQWRRRATQHDIEFQTKQAYYDCLSARALVLVAEDSVLTFERHRSDTQRKLDVGLSSRFEVLRAETELGSRLADVVEAKNRQRLAYSNLRRILAIPQDTPLVLADRITWVPLDAPPSELTGVALENRPEILALARALDAAEQDVKRAKGPYWPRAALTGEWTNSDGAGTFVQDGFAATLGFEWDIWAGGKRKRDAQEAEARAESLEYQLADLELLVEFDVYQGYIQVRDSIAKIKRERGNINLAQEGLRLAILRFTEGVGTQSDVLDAQLALTNAETQLVLALREYALAHAGLARATGQSWLAEKPPTD